MDTRTRPGRKKPDGRGEQEGSGGKGPESNNASEAKVLFVDVVFGNLSAIFLAASVSSRSHSLFRSPSDSVSL